MTVSHTFVSAEAPSADPDLVDSDKWNDAHTVDTDGIDIPMASSTPAAPPTDNIRFYNKSVGGSPMPAIISPSGPSYALQPLFGQKKIAIWSPLPNSTTTTGAFFGIVAMNNLGTLTGRAIATTNFFTTMSRVAYVSTTSAGSRAAGYGVSNYWRGNAAGLGGFRAVFRFGISDPATVANANMFVGFAASSAIMSGSTEPSAGLNTVGVGMDSTETVLSIMHNDGSGTATKVSLGANFPTNTLSVDAFELVLFAVPNGSEIKYQVTRLNTGDTISGTITTNLPVSTQLLIPMMMRGNMSTALAVGIDIMGMYIETEG